MLSFNPLELFRLRSKNTQVPFPSYKFEEAEDLSAFDKLLPSEEGDHIHVSLPTTSRRERNYRVITAINVVVLLASMLTFGLAYSNSYHLRHNIHNSLLRNVDFFSPVHDLLDINFSTVQINGSLLPMKGGDSHFRAPPSPEVDKAWARIGNLIPFVISTEDVVRLGKDPSKTARYPEDWGFGPDAHVAELDVLHTIHCLNAIRRDVHWQNYFKDEYPDGVFPELHRTHTDHCIYIVLQNLMCSATADIVTNPWVEGQLHPFPDFAVNKKCRDFESLVEWQETNRITDIAKYADLRIPEGHVPYSMSDEFRRMFGVTGENPFHVGGHK